MTTERLAAHTLPASPTRPGGFLGFLARMTGTDVQDLQRLVPVLTRMAAYLAAAFVLMLALPRVAGGDAGRLFRESGPVQWTQLGFLVLTGGLLILAAAIHPARRGFYGAAAGVAMLALVRELDSAFDRLIPVAGWKAAAAAVGLGLAGFAWWHRRSLITALADQVDRRPFALLFCGFLVVVPFAQLFGHGPLQRIILGEAYHPDIKRILEEIAELFGYFLLLLGAVECLLGARADPTPESPLQGF